MKETRIAFNDEKSLAMAIKNQDKDMIKEIEKRAKKGEVVRIM